MAFIKFKDLKVGEIYVVDRNYGKGGVVGRSNDNFIFITIVSKSNDKMKHHYDELNFPFKFAVHQLNIKCSEGMWNNLKGAYANMFLIPKMNKFDKSRQQEIITGLFSFEESDE
jgi:hypothetical protein